MILQFASEIALVASFTRFQLSIEDKKRKTYTRSNPGADFLIRIDHLR